MAKNRRRGEAISNGLPLLLQRDDAWLPPVKKETKNQPGELKYSQPLAGKFIKKDRRPFAVGIKEGGKKYFAGSQNPS